MDKLDFLYKQTQGRLATSSDKEVYEEVIATSPVLDANGIWAELGFLPQTAPALNSGDEYLAQVSSSVTSPVIRRYVQLVLSASQGTTNVFTAPELADAIPYTFGDGSYTPQVYDAQGNEIPFGAGDWLVDAGSGSLVFFGTPPAGAPYKISFFKYIGRKALTGLVTTSGSTAMDSQYVPINPKDVATVEFVTAQGQGINSSLGDLLNKLLPPAPPNLSTRTLAVQGAYQALRAATGVSELCVSTPTPVIVVSGPFADGDKGVLTATVDGQPVGSRTLTAASDVGLFGALDILQDVDPYAGQQGKQDFFKELVAEIHPQGLTVASHTAVLQHSVSGQTPSLPFVVDDPITPSILGGVVTTVPDTRFVSGVPSLAAGQQLGLTFGVKDAVRSHYSSPLATVAATGIALALDPGAIPSSGDVINFTPIVVAPAQAYAENFVINLVGFNSARGQKSKAISTAMRIDTVSDESIRVTSGVGDFPTVYGGVFDSQVSLVGNEELQLLAGSFGWPVGDYSANLPTPGPVYTGISSGYRWATFKGVVLVNANGFHLTLLGPQGLTADAETAITLGMKIFVKVEGVTGWLDANNAYPGSGSPAANGSPAMLVSQSSAATKVVTFGPTTRSGQLYVRVGIQQGVQKFTGISTN